MPEVRVDARKENMFEFRFIKVIEQLDKLGVFGKRKDFFFVLLFLFFFQFSQL